MSIDDAIARLENQLEELGLGGTKQPAGGSTDWYILRAIALGLSHLRHVKQLGHGEKHLEADRIYKKALASNKELK